MEDYECKELREKRQSWPERTGVSLRVGDEKESSKLYGDEATVRVLPEFSLPPRRTKAAPMRVMPV